jgi:PQQ-like domain
MLTRTLRALAALGLVTASGCWLQTGFDAGRSGNNGGETTITSATVGDLAVAWSVPVGSGAREAVVSGGTAYVRSSGSVRALDVATGATRWTVGPAGSGAAAIAGNRLWVPASGDACALQALDPRTGGTLSSTPMGGPAVSGTDAFSACLAGDALSAGGRIVTSWTYAAIGLSPHGGCFPDFDNLTGNGTHTENADGTGGGINTGGLTSGCGNPGIPPAPSTLSSDGTVIYELTGTGIARYFGGTSLPLPAAPGFVPVPTVAAGGRLVLTSTDGRMFVLDAATGAVQWRGTFGTSASVPVAVTPTTVFAADGAGTLAAFALAGCGAAAACAPTWTATTTGAATARPSVGGDVVYVGGDDGSITAFAAGGCGAATCGPLWSDNVGSAVSSSPVIDRGTLYVGGSTTLTAYRLPA